MVQMNAIAGALGFVPSADPKAYTNQVTITQQTTEAITALKTTATMVSTFATAMTLIPGGDPVFVQKIKDLDAKAKNAVASTAGKSPAQIAKDTSEITSALSSLQLEKSAPVEKTEIEKLRDALVKINERIDEVEKKNLSDDLIQPYRDLKAKTEGRISDLIALEVQEQQAKKEKPAIEEFQNAPASDTVKDDPLDALDKLNAATIKVIENDVSPIGVLRNIISHTGKAIYYILLVACLWLGGAATSNTFYDKSLLVKLWYFIYGAILFQLTIPIYGIFFPPKWHAIFIPLFDNSTFIHDTPVISIVKAVFGYDTIRKTRIPQEGSAMPEEEDEESVPTKVTEATSVKTAGKNLLNSQQALRYTSIGVYIAFHTFYYALQYFF
jgi:hypothetical protein